MFNNSGEKIQLFAKILFWLEAIGGSIVSIVFAVGEYSGGFIAIGGIIASVVTAYITALFLTAFGELVQNTKTIASQTKGIHNTDSHIASAPAQPVATNNTVDGKQTAASAPSNKTEQSKEREKEDLYQFALAHIKEGKKMNITSAIKDLELLSGYKDADKLLEECKQKLKDLQ